MSRTYLRALALAWMAWAGPSQAGTGDAAVARFDELAAKPSDTWFRFEASTQEAGRPSRTLAFTVQNKGTKRFVHFEKPSDMRGTRVLVLSRQQMYVYLPAFKKVRRVASHVTEQGFMGTTYSDEDMSTTHFGAIYESELVSQTQTHRLVTLSPRPGASTGYGKLEMDLSIELGFPSEIRFYDAEHQHIKTETRGSYDCGQGICTPGEMTMTDHRRSDARTTLTVLERRVNAGISDSAFSVRALERGR
jgi:outer membrane lipoprotein-sorting protein